MGLTLICGILVGCAPPKSGGSGSSATELCLSASSFEGFEAQSENEKIQIDPAYLRLSSPLALLSPLSFDEGVKVPQGTRLVVLVDHNCRVTRAPANSIAQEFESPPTLDLSKTEATMWAHQIQLNEDFSLSNLRAEFDDECIKTVSVDIPMKKNLVPDDTSYGSQNYLTAVNAPAAWDVFWDATTGINQSVTIAVIDDGIQLNHTDLSANIWTNPDETAGNGLDDDSNGKIDDVNGWNFENNVATPSHSGTASHGSHVAGIAAARWQNTSQIAGVMGEQVKIMALNVFGNESTTTTTNIVNAINYAVAKGANVINMSLGGVGSSASVRTAMESAAAAGVVMTISAGNDSTQITSGNFYIPAGYAKDINGAISVGSFDATDDTISSFSNYSTTYVEIGAPGSDSALGGIRSTVPTNTLGYKQGTSMSSPVVAGAAALSIALSKSRSSTPTAAEVESKITTTATQSSVLKPYFKCGRRLNLSTLATYTSSNP